MNAPQGGSWPRVPYGMAVHGDDEIAAVVNVLRTSTQMGVHVQRFEQAIAALFDKRHGIMVNSGSSALLLAAEILGLPPGSEVITPALTFATTVSSLIKNGLVPAFVDAAEASYCIDADQIESMISSRTRALCIPNLVGNLPDWRKISDLARKHGLVIIEDSADTLGATIAGRSSGQFSDVSITSFYGSHVINCAGNGGMLCVNDDAQARRARLLRSWGRSSSLFVESENIENRFDIRLDDIEYDAKFVFEAIGYNLEPSELGAAFGLVQLEKLASNIERRIQNFSAQEAFFGQYPDWFILPRQAAESRTGWLAFPLTLRAGAPFSRRELQIFLEQRNIQTRVVFTGNICRQPAFRDVAKQVRPGGYPVADQVMRGGMLLACHHGLTATMLTHVHDSFREFAARYL